MAEGHPWMHTGLVRDPLNAFVAPRRGTLTFCRSATEACHLAATAVPPGTAISLTEADGHEIATVGAATVFGPVVRSFHSPGPAELDSLVMDTLKGSSDQDVWFHVTDPEDIAWYKELALAKGHAARRADGPVPDPVPDPFSLFEESDARTAPGRETVIAYCKVDVSSRQDVAPSAQLSFRREPTADGREAVWFVDGDGRDAGMLGIMPGAMDADAAALVDASVAHAEGCSYGKELRGGVEVLIQTLQVRIPVGVDAVLANARLPPSECAAGTRGNGPVATNWSPGRDSMLPRG